MTEWWETFFDTDYLRLWEGSEAGGNAERQVDGLWSVLGLDSGSKVLDAPCGYGRISQVLAARGANVLGVDISAALLEHAEARRGTIPSDRLRYRRHDLRTPLDESGFDVALNLFTSIGYGSEADDLRIVSVLRNAVRPGGLVFIETNHRDNVAAKLMRPARSAHRLPDGTLFVEESRLVPLEGRVHSTWYWSGSSGQGQRHSSIRSYTAGELARLVEAGGLRIRSTHRGCFPEPFVAADGAIGNRLGILAERAD